MHTCLFIHLIEYYLCQEHMAKQLSRVAMQAQAVAMLYRRQAIQQLEFAYTATISETAKDIAIDICSSPFLDFKSSTLLDWGMDYRRKESFATDMRGKYERDWLLQNEELLLPLRTWMVKMAKKDALAIDEAVKVVNEKLLPAAAADRSVIDQFYKFRNET